MKIKDDVRRDLLALAAYFLLTLVLTYPLVLHFGTHVAGDGSDDPALGWNLWWVRYALFDLGQSPIYADYMFFPIGLNLAFYTLTYLNAFLSIPFQFTLGLVTGANINLLLSFTLSGFGAYLMVRYLLGNHLTPSPFRAKEGAISVAAFVAGVVYAFSSNKFLYASLGQFNIASSQWIPFYILFLLKAFPWNRNALRHSVRYGFLLGLFLLFQALSEFIFASFLIICTVVYLVIWVIHRYWQSSGATGSVELKTIKHPINRLKPRLPHESNHQSSIINHQSLVSSLLILAVTFLLPMSPILAAMIADLRTEGDFFQSGLGFSNSFSADVLGFFVPSHLHPLFGGFESQFNFAYINFMYLGYVALALAILALIKVKAARGWSLAFVGILLITLGPTLRVNGTEFDVPLPFDLLLDVPFIKGNRYPSRWSVMLTLCLAVMVGYGVAWVLRVAGDRLQVAKGRRQEAGGRRHVSSRRFQVKGLLLATALCLLLTFEHLSIPLPLSDFRIPEIYSQIAREPGAWTVMEIPLAWRNGFRVTGSYRADSQATIDRIFMYAQWYQTMQQHPILNGNTSRNPELKFQYFYEAPILNSLIAIQTGHSISPERQDADRVMAWRVLEFFGTRYVIWHAAFESQNSEVAEAARQYIENVLPVTKISEVYEKGRGLVVYRVNQLPSAYNFSITSSTPLARLHLGEGWGTVGDKALWGLWVTRTEAQFWLPITMPRDMQLRLMQLISPLRQGMTILVNGQSIASSTNLPMYQQDYRAVIPARLLNVGMNEITLKFDHTISVGQFASELKQFVQPLPLIGTTGVRAPISIVVRSAGEEQGAFGHIFVNGTDESPNARGYNLVVMNPQNGAVEQRANFDTFALAEKSSRMADFIEQTPDGRIVAVAASDDAAAQLTDAAVAALRQIGAQQDLRGTFRWSHAILGVKGAPPGSALETASELEVSQIVAGIGTMEPGVAVGMEGIAVEPVE